jgi:hypothetical protein
MAHDMSSICGYISHSNVINCINAHNMSVHLIGLQVELELELMICSSRGLRHDEYIVHHARNILSCSTSNADSALYEYCCRETAVCRSAESPAESRVRLSRPCR